jgi:hypothetical protein
MAQIVPVTIDRSAEREAMLRSRMGDDDQRHAVGIVLAMLDAERNIAQQQFVLSKQDALMADIRRQAARDLAEEIVRLRTDAARETSEQVDAREERRRDALSEPLDLQQLDRATNAAAITVLLRDAEADGTETLRRMWSYAEPRLRAMALDDQRRQRLPGATSAFNALTLWQVKLAGIARTHPDADALARSGDQRQREITRKIVEIASIAGLRSDVMAIIGRQS